MVTTRDDRQALYDRLVAAGAGVAEARRTAGLPALPKSAPKPKTRARRRRGRPRVKTPRIRVAPASSFGAVIAQMFGLVLLYWVIRSAGAVNTILDRIGSAFRWFVDPVGWGQRPD